jgi:hypothetical protein
MALRTRVDQAAITSLGFFSYELAAPRDLNNDLVNRPLHSKLIGSVVTR